MSATYKRWHTPRDLVAVVRYEWRTRKAWKTRRAMLCGLWWALVKRYAFELCEGCGQPHRRCIGDTYWRASDDLWARVAGWPHWRTEMGEMAYLGPPGTLCPRCFTERAERAGIRIYWQAIGAAAPDTAGDGVAPKSLDLTTKTTVAARERPTV